MAGIFNHDVVYNRLKVNFKFFIEKNIIFIILIILQQNI